MRVIAGKYRGRRIAAPEGRATRPTTDRVRESLMSTLFSLLHGSFSDCNVFDAFAGSGAFGIECLSRGAHWVCATDKNRKAIRTIQQNCAFIPPHDVSIQTCDVERVLPDLQGHTINLVFLDPPYAMSPARVADIVRRMQQAGICAPECVIAYEHDSANADAAVAAFSALGAEFVKRKAFHSTSISLFRLHSTGDLCKTGD